MIADIADFLLDELKTLVPSARCYIGELPTTAPALALQIAGGASQEQYRDTKRLMRLSLSLFVRMEKQKDALEALDVVQESLCRRTAWQCNAEDYQIVSVEATSLPSWLGQEDRGDYLYAMGLEVRCAEKT